MTHDAPTKINEGKRYAYSALCTFAATFFLFPICVALMPFFPGALHEVTLDGLKGFVFLMLFFGGIQIAIKMFIPAMAVGAISFYASRKFIAAIIGRKIGAFVSTMISAYIGVLFAFHLDIDLNPLAVTWRSEPGGYRFSRTLGIFAAVVSVPISAIFFRKDNVDA